MYEDNGTRLLAQTCSDKWDGKPHYMVDHIGDEYQVFGYFNYLNNQIISLVIVLF